MAVSCNKRKNGKVYNQKDKSEINDRGALFIMWFLSKGGF